MSINLRIKKGLDIPMAGAVDCPYAVRRVVPTIVAVVPDDFPGFTPKMEVKEGDSVVAGQPLAHDKRHEEIKLASPASGRVRAIVRGERRKIERIEVEVDQASIPPTTSPEEQFADSRQVAMAPAPASRQEAKAILLGSGLWPMIRQRPFQTVPDPDRVPRDIFVSGFDSAPLAADDPRIFDSHAAQLEAGVALLAKLTDGKVYVSFRSGAEEPCIPGAEMVSIAGPHPASLPGTMISAIRPIDKGQTVWTLDIFTLCRIGALALTGSVPFATSVAVVGSEVEHPEVVETIEGAPLTEILKGNIADDGRHRRYISGNVLTGANVGPDGFLRFPYTQVTVIPEGDDADEFMGWASLSPSKLSTSRSFPGHFLFNRRFRPDARVLGGRRAMILSGQHDRYIPIDILPEYLLKAIIARDIDRMEALGIYEVVPEDFALAEYADVSKMELQRIVREGLDYLRKETE